MDWWKINRGFIQILKHYLIHVPVMLGFILQNVELVEEKSGCHVGHSQIVRRYLVQVLLDLFLLFWVVDDVLFDVHFVTTT